jgi:hypothetical protein
MVHRVQVVIQLQELQLEQQLLVEKTVELAEPQVEMGVLEELVKVMVLQVVVVAVGMHLLIMLPEVVVLGDIQLQVMLEKLEVMVALQEQQAELTVIALFLLMLQVLYYPAQFIW